MAPALALPLVLLLLRDVRSGDLVPVSVIPALGEIDESGEELAIIVIGDTTFVERVRSHVPALAGRLLSIPLADGK